MRHKPRMLFQPSLNLGRFVGAIVVHYQVQIQFLWELRIQSFEEIEKFLMPMAGVTLAEHLACRPLQGRKERGGAAARVASVTAIAAELTPRAWTFRLHPSPVPWRVLTLVRRVRRLRPQRAALLRGHPRNIVAAISPPDGPTSAQASQMARFYRRFRQFIFIHNFVARTLQKVRSL